MANNVDNPLGEATNRTVVPIVVTPGFKYIFWGVLFISVISLAVALFLASSNPITETQKELYSTCSTIWKMGCGAIIGLLGGRATS